MASASFCPLGVLAVLAAIQAKVSPRNGTPWCTQSDMQDAMLVLLEKYAGQVKDAEGLRTKVSHDIEELNAWLRGEGFDIQLGIPLDPAAFGVVSIIKLAVEWLKCGKPDEISIKGKGYPAFVLDTGFTVYGDDTAVLTTNTRDHVILWKGMSPGTDSLHLLTKALEVLRGVSDRRLNERYDKISVPCVDMNDQPNMTWLNGLATMGEDEAPAIIAQALQQNKLQMNEKGARVESATAAFVFRGMSPRLIFDGPFLFVWERNDLPLFVAWCDTDVFRRPE